MISSEANVSGGLHSVAPQQATHQSCDPGEEPIFVVGSSRSGTTMLGRVLGRNSLVHTFPELHFFEEMWSGAPGAGLDTDQAIALLSELYSVYLDGYLAPGRTPARYTELARRSIEATGLPASATALFANWLEMEARKKGKTRACDQTPRNIYSLDTILTEYPRARIVVMMRDPRDVLLSQKRKWRRRSLGAAAIPRREAFRSWVNYHPLTISILWRATYRKFRAFRNDPRVLLVKYEDLVREPERQTRMICGFLGLPFEEGMLEVPVIGSSNARDSQEATGITADNVGRWRLVDGLSTAEVAICQNALRLDMVEFGYEIEPMERPWFRCAVVNGTFPFKAAFSLFLNRGRSKNLLQSIRRRLG